MNMKNKILAGLVISILAGTSLVHAADVSLTAPVIVNVGGLNLTLTQGSTATSYIVGATTLTVTTGVGETFEVISTDRYSLSTNSTTAVMVCSDAQSRVTVTGSATVIITPSSTTCTTPTTGTGGSSSGGSSGGGSSSPSTPAVTPEKAKETPKVEEKAPAKTKEVAKELKKKLTLMDSKSKASLVLQKGTQLTVGDAPYAGSVSSPGQLNPSKAIVDFGSPSATGRVVQAVQSKTTGDVVVWLNKSATLTFKMTPAQKTTKYKGKERYALEAYYYNPTTKAFTKLTGKKKGANFTVSNVTYIGGPFFLVETDMKPAAKAKKTK